MPNTTIYREKRIRSYFLGGFILLELLVIIVIIGLIASIVMVLMTGLREKARIANSLSFSHQIQSLLGVDAVLQLRMNEGTFGTCSGGEDVCDISGHENHCITHGDTHWVSDAPTRTGYSFSFDGSGDHVDCGTSAGLNITDAITIEMWAKTNDPSPGGQSLYSKGDLTLRGHMQKWTEVGLFQQSFICEGGVRKIDVSFPTQRWVHFVATYNPIDGGTVYLDGKFHNSVDPRGKIVSNSSDELYIGKSFNGLIDEFRIYSASLRLTEIQKHYTQGLKKLYTKGLLDKQEYQERLIKLNKEIALK